MSIYTRRQQTSASRRGFTLIELAIVLAIASLLFAGLWRLMASGNTQLRDQAAADQHLQLVNAVSAFLATSDGQSWMATLGAYGTANLPMPTSNTSVTNCKSSISDTHVKILCEYLPLGFTGIGASSSVITTNSYGQNYEVRVLKDGQVAGTSPKSYSFMVVTINGDTIADTSGGRIAGLIGNDGGFIYSSDVCGSGFACGAYGSWAVSPSGTYGFGDAETGHVASRTYAGLHASQSTPWLARSLVAQSPSVSIVGGTAYDFNTIQADTYLGLVSSTSTIATLSGAVAGYGGSIRNIRTMLLGRSSDTPNGSVGADPALEVTNAGCSITDPQDKTQVTNCNYIANFTGDINISGMLVANKLYAGQFIYQLNESDNRLKTDILPIKDALEKIGKIEGYSFTMKRSGEKKLGVIAQEVEKVFPEIVQKLDSKYIGVDYIGLIGPLVAAVKELKEENDLLKQQLATQGKAIEELQKKVDQKAE